MLVPAANERCGLEVDGGPLGQAVLPSRFVALRASVEAFFLRVCDLGTSEGERRAKSRGDVLETPVGVLKPGWAGDDNVW